MLLAHKVLMNELTNEAGTFRSGGVGVFAGKQLVHMAPPANQVPHLINFLNYFCEYKSKESVNIPHIF